MICSVLTLTLSMSRAKKQNKTKPLFTDLCDSHLQQGQISEIPLIKRLNLPCDLHLLYKEGQPHFLLAS